MPWSRAGLVERWSDHTVNAAVRAGVIARVAPGLYVAADHLERCEWRVTAAARWALPQGAVSGCAALWLHGVVDTAPARVTIATPHRFKRRPLPYVRLRRSTVEVNPVRINDIPAVPLVDAILHAWEEIPRQERPGLVLDAIRRGSLSSITLRARLGEYPRIRGRAALNRLLDQVGSGVTSYLEFRARTRVFNTSEFAALTWQAPVSVRGRRYILDAYDARARLAIELDGRAFHSDDAARRGDLERDARLASVGIQTVRFTYEDIVRRPEWCRVMVRNAARWRRTRMG